jgi:D-glycero-D-manno-heptose 1,7-bisphosphate phosphatase
VKLLILDPAIVLASTDEPSSAAAATALARLAQAGWRLVLWADQGAVARAASDLAHHNAVHGQLINRLAAAGAAIDLVAFAPPPEGTDRPSQLAASLTELLLRLAIPAAQTTLVADTPDALIAAHQLGCQPVLVLTGRGRATFAHADLPPDTLVRVDLGALAADLTS